MSKAQMLEDAQEFIGDYENICDTLQYLFDSTDNNQLKEEVNGLISVLEEDYKNEYENQQDIASRLEQEEEDALNYEYERMRA